MIAVTDLCGVGLCTELACCSYLLNGRRVYLCKEHLLKLIRTANMNIEDVMRSLPEFEAIDRGLE